MNVPELYDQNLSIQPRKLYDPKMKSRLLQFRFLISGIIILTLILTIFFLVNKQPIIRNNPSPQITINTNIPYLPFRKNSKTTDPRFIPGTSCPLFPPDNILNQDITTLPVNPMSVTWIATVQGRNLDYDFGPPPDGMPFILVDHTTQRIQINFHENSANNSDVGQYPFNGDTPVQQSGGNDRHALMIDRDSCMLYELFDAQWNNGKPKAGAGAVFNLRSNVLRPEGKSSADDAGLPIFPLLLSSDEIRLGEIKHAIRFSTQRVDSSLHLWPARFTPSYLNTPNHNLPPMGARFRLKQNYDISGFTAPTRVVLRALKHYGMILSDIGFDWTIIGTQNNNFPEGIGEELKKVPSTQLEAVDESLLMLDHNSGAVR